MLSTAKVFRVGVVRKYFKKSILLVPLLFFVDFVFFAALCLLFVTFFAFVAFAGLLASKWTKIVPTVAKVF